MYSSPSCGLAIVARRAAASAAVVVVARAGQHLAEFFDRRGLQPVEDFDLRDARLDDLPGQGVHLPRAGDRLANAGQLVGVLAAAEAIQRRLDIDSLAGQRRQVRREAGELDADPLEAGLVRQRLEQLDARRLPLVVAQRAVPLGFVGHDVVGGRFQRRLLRRDERQMPIGRRAAAGDIVQG